MVGDPVNPERQLSEVADFVWIKLNIRHSRGRGVHEAMDWEPVRGVFRGYRVGVGCVDINIVYLIRNIGNSGQIGKGLHCPRIGRLRHWALSV